MDLIEHEAQKREMFFKRIRYFTHLSNGEDFTIKEIHEALDINDRQVSRELRELDSYGLVNLRNEGKNVFVSISNIGLRFHQQFFDDIENRPMDLEKISHNKILSFIDRYNTASNSDTKKLAMQKINESFWDIRRTTNEIDWEKEKEIVDFINKLLKNLMNEEKDTIHRILDVLRFMVNSGFFNKTTFDHIKNLIKEEKIKDDKLRKLIINYAISFSITILEKKPEHKETLYPLLLISLKRIKSDTRDDYHFLTNDRQNIKNLPAEIREPLTEELFKLMNNKSNDERYTIIEDVINYL